MNVLPLKFKRHLSLCSAVILAAHLHCPSARAMEEESPKQQLRRALQKKAERKCPLEWHDATPKNKEECSDGLQFIMVNPKEKIEALKRKQRDEPTQETLTAKRARRGPIHPGQAAQLIKTSTEVLTVHQFRKRYNEAEELLRQAGLGNGYARATIEGEAFQKEAAHLLFIRAKLYLTGEWEEKDEGEGTRLLTHAADLGNVEAQCELGLVYVLGEYGLEKDEEQALHYFKLAAAQGNAGALCALGVAYTKGIGSFMQNEEEATEYYMLAAAKGYRRAYEKVSSVDPELGDMVFWEHLGGLSRIR